MGSLQELLVLMLIIAVFSLTGIWPHVIRGLRQLRGEYVEEPEYNQRPRGNRQSGTDIELCYKILGVSPSAPWEEIEKAYRRKARIHHPDHGGDDDTMRALNEAYAILKQGRRSVR